MGDIDTGFARRYSHATVSRWESGFTRPTVERLVVFARALNLSPTEAEGLLALAGLASIVPDLVGSASSPEQEEYHSGPAPSPFLNERKVLVREVWQFLTLRVILVGVCVALSGFAISLPDWNVFVATAACFGISALLVVGQGFLFADRENSLREFFWVTLFFVLGTPLLQFAPLGMTITTSISPRISSPRSCRAWWR